MANNSQPPAPRQIVPRQRLSFGTRDVEGSGWKISLYLFYDRREQERKYEFINRFGVRYSRTNGPVGVVGHREDSFDSQKETGNPRLT